MHSKKPGSSAIFLQNAKDDVLEILIDRIDSTSTEGVMDSSSLSARKRVAGPLNAYYGVLTCFFFKKSRCPS
jgi:hypothetical protein